MSHIPFYQNVGSNFTFQNNMLNMPIPYHLPPPPPPPVTPFSLTPELSDQEYIKKFENRIPKDKPIVKKVSVKVSDLNESLHTLVLSLQDIKNQEEKLSKNLDTLTDHEWKSILDGIQISKDVIEQMITKLSGSYLDVSKKLVAKRIAKRLRLKRLREERKKEKKERLCQLEERSRKIDENLQKIKDDIQKAKQEEEAKVQADIVLKEVLRKKTDAKKCVTKLNALLKLREARRLTAKGRGQIVSDTGTTFFENNIERLKKLWAHKLLGYEKEEADSRALLEKNDQRKDPANIRGQKVGEGLVKWRVAMFGVDRYPQFDFEGDVTKFIDIRSQWDNYVDNSPESTPLPMGWVVPSDTSAAK